MTRTTQIIFGAAFAVAASALSPTSYALDSYHRDSLLETTPIVTPAPTELPQAAPVATGTDSHGFEISEPLVSGDFRTTTSEADEGGFAYIPEPSTLAIAVLVALGSVPVALRRKWG